MQEIARIKGGNFMWTREQLKREATWAYKRNYGASIVAALIFVLVTGGGSFASGASNGYNSANGVSPEITLTVALIATGAALVSLALTIFVFNPLVLGVNRFFVKNFDENAELSEVAYVFKSGNYGNAVGCYLLMDLFVGLWTLLFIVPGIIKAYEYRMVPYLLSENPGMTWTEAKDRSKAMMDGNKWDAFVLDLSFIGWDLLSILTCGILSIVMVNPYKFSTKANLYRVLSGKPQPIDYSMQGDSQNGYQQPNQYQDANYTQPNQAQGSFDPYTGEPINKPQANFDPYTGEPINNNVDTNEGSLFSNK